MSRSRENVNGLQSSFTSSESETSSIRQLFDALVCLSMAVILFRTFEVEGYIISTGSMAPSLLGYHKRVDCPVCGYSFVFGATHDEVARTTTADSTKDDELNGLNPPIHPGPDGVVCPNCGQDDIDISGVPRNEGDQLLVYKHAYLWKKPRRWEVIVFRNPNKPTQSYVKRLVGLPGESLQIIGGDIYADGKIQQKNLSQLRATRILVYDFDHQPQNDPTWQPRWIPDAGWIRINNGFEFERRLSNNNVSSQPFAWVSYRHWVRKGGKHKTSVRLDSWPDDAGDARSLSSPVWYDEKTKMFSCRGAMSKQVLERLQALTEDSRLRQSFQQLYEESHDAPITDDYGYNQFDESRPVRDLMLSLNMTFKDGNGEFVLRISDGRHHYACVFDIQKDEVRLLVDDNLEPVRIARLPIAIHEETVLIEMSVADRQVLAAIDGQMLFPPWTDSDLDRQIPGSATLQAQAKSIKKVPRKPVYFAARGIDVRIDGLKLYRDLYYTARWERHAVTKPFQLGYGEYFVLGDNSPVSVDSRAWTKAAVESRMILGKPFLVHLPSRPGHIRIGKYDCHIRIPDWSRIRYIR